MTERRLTIVVDAEDATCGGCDRRDADYCDEFGADLEDVAGPDEDVVWGRCDACLSAESVARKSDAVVEAARVMSNPHSEESELEIMINIDNALDELDAAKGGAG